MKGDEAARFWHNCIHKHIGSFTISQEKVAIEDIRKFLLEKEQELEAARKAEDMAEESKQKCLKIIKKLEQEIARIEQARFKEAKELSAANKRITDQQRFIQLDSNSAVLVE